MKKPSKETLIKWGLLFIVLAGITGLLIHREYSLISIFSSLKHANPLWLIPALFAMIIFMLCEGINIGRCLKLTGHHISLLDEIKYAMTGFFFSSITPSASGGQPMQVYSMYKDGLAFSHSSLALLAELTSFQAAAAILATIGIIRESMANTVGSSVTIVILAAGIVLNLVILAILLFLIFSQSAVKTVASPVIFLLEKLCPSKAKIYKIKILRGISEYRKAAKYIKHNPMVMVKAFSTSVIQLLAYFSITFFVFQSLGLQSFSWAKLTFMQAILYVSVSALPLPGAVGVSEGGFSLLFASLIPDGLMGIVMVLSRFFSFILPLVVSGIGVVLLNRKPGSRNPGHHKSGNQPRYHKPSSQPKNHKSDGQPGHHKPDSQPET